MRVRVKEAYDGDWIVEKKSSWFSPWVYVYSCTSYERAHQVASRVKYPIILELP